MKVSKKYVMDSPEHLHWLWRAERPFSETVKTLAVFDKINQVILDYHALPEDEEVINGFLADEIEIPDEELPYILADDTDIKVSPLDLIASSSFVVIMRRASEAIGVEQPITNIQEEQTNEKPENN